MKHRKMLLGLLQTWVILAGVARINFLTLTVVSIALSWSAAWSVAASIPNSLLFLVGLIAMAAHISVNAFNEYADFTSGLDYLTERTPFSGGSGTLILYPQGANLALMLAWISFILCVGLGVLLASWISWSLLALGACGLLLVITYTPYLNRSAWLCFMAPGLGFGALMTGGAYWVFTQSFDARLVFVVLVMSLLASNLLLLNQFPDIDADKQVGRGHLPIRLGPRMSAFIFAGVLLLLYVILLAGVFLAGLPWQILLAGLTFPFGFKIAVRSVQCAESTDQVKALLGQNVILTHAFPVLLCLGLIFSRVME